MYIENYYNEYKELGIKVIPIEWDVKAKGPVSHRLWSKDVHELSLLPKHNALMIKTDEMYGCLDFDIKNTERKTIFDEFKAIVLNQWPELYDKCFIEKTRNAGYHVWIKYPKLKGKISLADSDKGSEVIALYANNPLVYTFPTPGYSEESGSMQDLVELNDKEFQYLISTSQLFNEYKPDYDPTLKAINYPAGYESLLSLFDKDISNEIFLSILKDIGLTEIPNYRYHTKDKFIAFRRKGSESPGISAKVYPNSKRIMIFSASLHDYPNWHNRHEYPVWSLPPSFILFYKNKRSWPDTIDYIKSICESVGLEIPATTITTTFPLNIFPDEIHQSILEVSEARSLAPQFVATAGLWAVSSLAGTRYTSDFGNDARNILFCLMIAPVSVGKTPAFKVMFENPLKEAQETMDRRFEGDLHEWNSAKSKAHSKKEPFSIPRPSRYIPIAVDGTTEGYISKSMSQKTGMGVYLDEAESILNAGSFKSTNDAVSFFTQAFSGGRITQIRADENKERVVPNLNLNVLMGTQPSRVKNIFTEDRLSSGFASRFLMVESDYNQLNDNADPFSKGKEMCNEWKTLMIDLYYAGMDYNGGNGEQIHIPLTDDAKLAYRSYYKSLLIEANKRIKSKSESYIIGTEAKMSAYLPRLIQIIAIIHNPVKPVITQDIVHKGWHIYRHYANSTIKIIAGLHGELETGLPTDLELLYQTLPETFTRKEAAEICTRINLQERRFDVSIRRKDFAPLFQKTGHGQYSKR